MIDVPHPFLIVLAASLVLWLAIIEAIQFAAG